MSNYHQKLGEALSNYKTVIPLEDFKPTNHLARNKHENKGCGAIGRALTQVTRILNAQSSKGHFTNKIF